LNFQEVNKIRNPILSLIQRKTRAKHRRNAPVSAFNVTPTQAGVPPASHAEVHHEPRRRTQHAGYTNGTYLSRSRRSSRQLMFRIT
jgi:hypothetical protein